MTVTAKEAMEEAAFLMVPAWPKYSIGWVWKWLLIDVPANAFQRSVWQQIPLGRTDFPTREDKVQEACWNTGAHGREPFIQRVYVRFGSPDAPQYGTYGFCSIEVCSRAEYYAKAPQEREGWILYPPYSRLPAGAEWRIWEANPYYINAFFRICTLYRAQQEE